MSMVWSEYLRLTFILMNSCRFLCISYDFYALILSLEVSLDFYSLVIISMSLREFLRLGLNVYGLFWLSTCCGNKEKAY